MRIVFLFLLLCGTAWPQALTEAVAAAAGGSVGGVAGKKVSDGVSNIFEKVKTTTDKAAETKEAAKPQMVLEVGPGTPKVVSSKRDRSLVPPPPPLPRAAVKTVVHRRIVEEVVAVAPPPPPPPPVVTAEDLQGLATGTSRRDVLKLGAPASRITMIDGGHLVEIYRYASRESSFGVVRLSDGSVSSVDVHP